MTEPDVLQQLGEALQADESLRAYILIDPLWKNPLDAALPEQEGCAVIAIPLKSASAPDHGETTYPRLIAWRPMAVGTLQASLSAALFEQRTLARDENEGFAVGGWLLSRESPAALAQHLQLASTIMLEKRRSARWGDRRLIEWMWPVLEPAQQAALFGPITAWWTIDRNGRLVQRCRPANVESADLPLRLNPVQATHWRQFSHAQHLIRTWCRAAPDPSSRYLDYVRGVIEDTQRLGLDNFQDTALLCAYAALVHPRIAQHPLLARAVAAAQEQDVPLLQTLADIPDPEGWNRMRRELTDLPIDTIRQGVH